MIGWQVPSLIEPWDCSIWDFFYSLYANWMKLIRMLWPSYVLAELHIWNNNIYQNNLSDGNLSQYFWASLKNYYFLYRNWSISNRIILNVSTIARHALKSLDVIGPLCALFSLKALVSSKKGAPMLNTSVISWYVSKHISPIQLGIYIFY